MHLSNTQINLILALLMAFISIMIYFILMILFFVQKKQRGFEHDLSIVTANYEKELFKAQLETQEQTFKDISREIHDNVGQILSLAKLGLGTLELDSKDRLEAGISEISDIMEKALDDLRHLSRQMNSETISNGGLEKSIRMQMNYLERGGKYKTHFNLSGIPVPLEDKKEVIIFRIVQESVNNIIKHAKASEIFISIFYDVHYFRIEIEDNGNGFNLEEQKSNPHLINGIFNMEKRAKLIDGQFELESGPGKGTHIRVTIPYRQ